MRPTDPNDATRAPKGEDLSAASPASDETTAPSGDTDPFGSSGHSGGGSHPWIGQRVGKYQIEDTLGAGGMGLVLRGFDTAIERSVAIKVLPAELSQDPTALARFLAEAKSAGKLNHPNTVTIYEIAQEGDTYYLVMELVSGGTAWDFIQQEQAYSVKEATRIVLESCLGLEAAHAAGLVHRDIKPANLLLAADGLVKVSDFGLAKRTRSESLAVTQEGQVLGTPYYMSPEQCEAAAIDSRSDIYSLGATYYSLLTGKCPYEESGNAVQVMYAHCNSPAPDPRSVRAEIPPACCQIITRAMAIQPDERYPTMEAMRRDLQAVLSTLSGDSIDLPSHFPSGKVHSIPLQTEGSRRWFSLSLVFGLVVLLGLILFWMVPWFNEGEGDGNANARNMPTAQGEPIRVGVLHSLTGTMAQSETPVKDAVLLAIEELNQSGGLLGRPVEAVVADGRSQDQVFMEEARRLVEQEKVAVLFGCWTSSSRKTVVPAVEDLDHLLIYPVQYEGIEESPNVFYMGAAPNQQIIPAVKWAYAFQNKRRFFLIGSDYVFPRVAHEIIKDELSELGAELVGEVFLPLGSTETKSVAQQIQQLNPDVILNCLNGDSNTAFFRALRNSGVQANQIPTISFSIGEEELKFLDVESMVGDYAAWNYFQSLELPENREFVDSFQSRYGSHRVITDPMESAYTAVRLWGQAVEEAGTLAIPEVRRSLRNQRIESPGGLVRTDSATQHLFKTPRIGQITSAGQFEIVWTAAKLEPPLPYPASRTTEQWRALLHDLFTGWGNRWSAPKSKIP